MYQCLALHWKLAGAELTLLFLCNWAGRDSEESYDWLARYENVAELLSKYVRPSDRILMV